MDSKTADNDCCPWTSATASPCHAREGEENGCLLTDFEQGQKNIQLSSSETAFAFLIESHAIALIPLNDLIITAIKSKYPHGWTEMVCSCFAGGMKKHIKERLENSSPLRDIFVICKIIRYRLHEITDYVGDKRMDAHVRERLSLQLQGVEASRHMAFHEEFISLPEVYSNVLLLISILTYLNCGKEQVESLQAIRSRIAETFQSERKSFHMLSMATLVKTMLYRSLREFEKEFSEYFKLKLGAGHENEDHEATVKKPSHSFSNFCKTIKELLCQKNMEMTEGDNEKLRK